MPGSWGGLWPSCSHCRSEGRWVPEGWDQPAPGAAGRCHGNGRILLSYSLLARTKPASSSSAQHRDVQCIPSTPAFPLSPAGSPLQSMQEESAGAGASCLFPTAGKPQVFFCLLFLPMLTYRSLLLIISSMFFSGKIQPMLLFPPPACNLPQGGCSLTSPKLCPPCIPSSGAGHCCPGYHAQSILSPSRISEMGLMTQL